MWIRGRLLGLALACFSLRAFNQYAYSSHLLRYEMDSEMKNMKIRSLYGLLLTSVLVIGACSLDSSSFNANSSEDLLAAEGEWKLVEEKRAPSPIQKHMETRGKVHPTNLAESKSYTESARGMHVDEDIHYRVLRLEKEMEAVRSDLEKVLPKIAALPDPKPNLKPMMGATSYIAAPKEEPKVAKAESHAEPKAAPQKAVSKKAIGGPLRVVAVRTGRHPGKTRFVMDLSNAAKFSYNLDNAEKILLVELPGIGWDTAAQRSFGKDPMVKSYSAQVDGENTRLLIELKKNAKVTMAQSFAPNHVHGHRLVLDIADQ
ncbi:MAG: hypothetical protein CMH26_05660 [Micavibrio sp.]|nr:hypothetical protein [Micavibrio sp.]